MNESSIHNLQEAINSRPCPVCGKRHTVRLNLVHSSTQSSTDITESCLSLGRYVLSLGFSDGSCEGFKERVIAFIKTWANRESTPPFPFPEGT